MDTRTPVIPPSNNGQFPAIHPSFSGGTLTPGFLLPVPAFRPIAPSLMGYPGLVPQVVRYSAPTPKSSELDALSVLQIASQSMSASHVLRIPPFHGECPDLWRAVVIERVPRHTSSLDLLRLLQPRNLESIRKIRDDYGSLKAELRFMNHAAALLFYSRYILNPLTLERNEFMSIAWSSAPPISAKLRNPDLEGKVSRYICLEIDMTQSETESIDDNSVFHQLWDILSTCGTLQTLQKTGNMNMHNSLKKSSVAKNPKSQRASDGGDVPNNSGQAKPYSFTKWKAQFAEAESAVTAFCEAKWDRIKKIEFGKEKPLHKLNQQAALLYLMRSPYDPVNLKTIDFKQLEQAEAYQSLAAALIGILGGDEVNIGNRCICISRLPPATRLVEVCNTVRGGMLESVKMIADKRVCFVTFLEPTAAAQFWATYQMTPFRVNCEEVRVGWGQHPGPLAPEIAFVANKNATRNVCIHFHSRICAEATDFVLNEAELGKIFSPFGIIEQIRVTPEVFCSFVTFANITSAVQAVDWARKSNLFQNCAVRFGKDRCAALPRFLTHSKMNESPLIQVLRELTSMLSPAPVMHSRHALPFMTSSSMTAPVAVSPHPSLSLLSTNSDQGVASTIYGDSVGTMFGGPLQNSN